MIIIFHLRVTLHIRVWIDLKSCYQRNLLTLHFAKFWECEYQKLFVFKSSSFVFNFLDLEGEKGEELGKEAFVHVLVHLVQEEPVPDATSDQLGEHWKCYQ